MDSNTFNRDIIDCPFCKAYKQKNIITNSDLSFAIFDKYPVNAGHVLIIPKRHCGDYFDLTQKEQLDCWKLINIVKEMLKSNYNPDGFNIGVNINECAGQTINHTHIHLIPRNIGDMTDPRGGIRHCVAGKGYY